MSYKTLAVSLPDDMAAMVEEIQERDQRSSSEVSKEALRQYLGIVEPPVPDWQKDLLLKELEAFRRNPDQESYSPEEVLERLRLSRQRAKA